MKKSTLVFFLTVTIVSTLCAPQLLCGKEEDVSDVVERIGRAVVNIRTEEVVKKGTDAKTGGFFKGFLTQRGDEDVEALENEGSGVVVDPRGVIVTNEHLISKAVTIRVKFTNRKEYEAQVLAADPELDIALLKVEDKNEFPSIKAFKDSVRVGQRTIVIGNPYGLSSSVTMGVVSAFRKNVTINNRTYVNLIQTDAAINPGNSGGALLDKNGNLLGIVTAVYEEARGIGFAIPIDDVMSMVSEFLEHAGKRPILGVFIEIKEDDDRAYLYVNRVIPASPAEKSGIRVGDKILELDGRKIREGMKVQNVFRKAILGGKTQLKIGRGKMTFTVQVGGAENYVPMPVDEALCGFRLSDIKGYPKMKFKLKDRKGAVVTKVYKGGIGERYGLTVGDVILKINNAEVEDRGIFQVRMVEGLRRNYILYQVKRGEDVFFLPIKFDTLL